MPANIEGHIDWINSSPAGQLAARHGIDWQGEPRVNIELILEPDDADYDFKCTADIVRAWGGTVDADFQAVVSVPPVVADTWQWHDVECCGWSVIS